MVVSAAHDGRVSRGVDEVTEAARFHHGEPFGKAESRVEQRRDGFVSGRFVSPCTVAQEGFRCGISGRERVVSVRCEPDDSAEGRKCRCR